MSEYSSHRSSRKRDQHSSYDERGSRDRRSREDRDSSTDRDRRRSRSRSSHRSSYRDSDRSSSYRSSHSKRKRSYERDYYEGSSYDRSRHEYGDKYERDSSSHRYSDKYDRDRDRDRDRDSRYTTSRRSNHRYDRERSQDKDVKDAPTKSTSAIVERSRDGPKEERESKADVNTRSMAAIPAAVETDSLPKAPAAYFQQQNRTAWDYSSGSFSEAAQSTWVPNASSDVYPSTADTYQYASYYRDPNAYYQDDYNQKMYHSTDSVPPPPPPPYPQAKPDQGSIHAPPPPPPAVGWPNYTYEGIPKGPAANRSGGTSTREGIDDQTTTEATKTLGVDNISWDIDLQVLEHLGYPVKSTEEPTEKYEKIGQVGEGTYGKVYKAKSKATGELVALKRIRMETEKEGFPITAMREIKLLQKLRHKRIVQLTEIMVSKGSVYMVLEYMDHDLTGVLGHPEFKFEPAHAKSLVKQMLEGVAFLHHMGVLHRDIKGSNLLLNKKGELKIADFGLARIFQKRRTHDYTNRVITLWYRPPELLLGATAYGPAVDMWSVGCIMLEFFTGKPVFNGTDEISQLEIIYKIMGTPDEESWPNVVDLPWYELMRPKEPQPAKFRDLYASLMSEGALELLEALLALDPSKRPSASDALKFRYFTSESPSMVSPANLLDIAGDWHEYESKRKRKAGTAVLNGNGNTKLKSSDTDKK